MPTVIVSQIKYGDKLSDPVYTKRGSLLMQKGSILTEREKEVLQAFMISYVSVENKPEPETKAQKPDANAESRFTLPVTPLAEEMRQMRDFLKQVFTSAQSGSALPILDIRTRLVNLIRQIDEYRPLFTDQGPAHGEDYMYYNSVCVALTSYLLAKWHGYPAKDWNQIALGGLLHNVGNAKVDRDIFLKKSELSDGEMEEIKLHTVQGYQILKNVPAINEGVKLCALQHHEKEDGTGYPFGVRGDKIHPYAKIVAISEIFHAMTSNRGYKRAVSPYLVLEQLFEESFGKLDPALVQTFINRVTTFTVGTQVILSDGRSGEIVFTERSAPTRPWVKCGETIVNLGVERRLFIQEVQSSPEVRA